MRLPFWARKAASAPPAGPAPTMSRSVSTMAVFIVTQVYGVVLIKSDYYLLILFRKSLDSYRLCVM